VDIAAKENAPIYPSQAGTVIFSGQKQGYGNVVILEHEGGYRTLYAHNKQNLVEKGQVVSPDRPIATVGQTGVATGPHVHFEIRKDGKPVNPLSLIA
jgi:murein DD-endopeptidase MepM/ murein hydrolase activator NlpD